MKTRTTLTQERVDQFRVNMEYRRLKTEDRGKGKTCENTVCDEGRYPRFRVYHEGRCCVHRVQTERSGHLVYEGHDA